MKKLIIHNISFGCDPEFFFSANGDIVGAENILPENGVVYSNRMAVSGESHAGKIIIDGVQAELNPIPSTCRQLLANDISRCFIELDKISKSRGVDLDFSQTVEVKKGTFDKLSDKSKKFGCAPSKNAHNKNSSIKINPSVYRKRSAGGHIHLGRTYAEDGSFSEPDRVVKMLDILLGNTCVLIDRDKGNIERRKSYGRAGEYRTPPHGLEYRTLSNFWLKNYVLFSFVMGLARMSVSIVKEDLDKEFLKVVEMKDVEKAINKNDFNLAYKNFLKIEPVLSEISTAGGYKQTLTVGNIPLFKHFVDKGVDYWFKESPLKHWVSLAGSTSLAHGWENFLEAKVLKDMEKTKQ